MTPRRVVFAGTPEFAVPALRTLLEGDHEVVGVLTQPDRPAGRGRKLTPSPVKRCAEQAGVPVHQPDTLKTADARDRLAGMNPDLLVVVAYGMILPPAFLAIPTQGCWNIHASLLPRWRGAAPIQRAILAGDDETGVCLMQMAEGLDTGPVIACRKTPIEDDDTAGSLHDRLAEMGASLLAQVLETDPVPAPRPQPEEGISYAHKLDKREALVDWSEPAQSLWRKVRAFNPWPGARGTLADMDLKIWRVRPVEGSGPSGDILRADADGIVVATGDGALSLLELQKPGGRRMSATDFVNAHQHLAR